jgi:MFS family permease
MVDCKNLLCGINLWLAVAAAGLAIPVWLRLINPGLILVWVFLMGIGFAFNAPASISIVPEIVSDAELPAATNLSGLQLNLAGIVGPPLGGLLVQLLGASCVFLVNAACFLFVIIAIRRWKRAIEQPKLRLENFLESFMTVFRYVRFAPRLQIVLTRNVLFALFISVIPALVPVVGLRALHLGPCQLGILFTSMGAGSIAAAAFISPWLRARYSSNTLISLANLLVVFVYVLMAFIRRTELFLVVAALAGVGWTVSASELWVAAQRAMPSWARGRMNAAVIMVSQGAMALGGVIWGCTATKVGLSFTLLGAAFLFLISLALAIPLSINSTGALSFNPAQMTNPISRPKTSSRLPVATKD